MGTQLLGEALCLVARGRRDQDRHCVTYAFDLSLEEWMGFVQLEIGKGGNFKCREKYEDANMEVGKYSSTRTDLEIQNNNFKKCSWKGKLGLEFPR